VTLREQPKINMDAETGSANIYGTITDMMEIFQRPSILLGREELCSGTSSKAPERAGICEPDDGEVDAYETNFQQIVDGVIWRCRSCAAPV